MKKLPPHVTKTRDGKFRVRYQRSKKYPIEYDKIFDKEVEAIKANDEYLAKNTLKLHKQIKHMGFSEFCDYYLDWFRTKPKKPKPRTIKSYKQYINVLKIAFGNPDINDMDTVFISNVLDRESNRSKRGNGAQAGGTISSNTLHHEYSMLSILFNKMYKWGFISVNPMNEIEAPEIDAKEIEVAEFSELAEIEAKMMTAPIRERCQFLLALFTGMRQEEVAGLHMNRDFNFDILEVSVNTVISQNEDGDYLETKPKSKKSIRRIPFPESFVSVFKEYVEYRKQYVAYLKMKNPSYQELPNLFLNKDGHFYRPCRIGRKWKAFREKPEINIDMTYHQLRHYYISNQMNFNNDLTEEEIQALAGHADIRTTRHYVHASKKRINQNATNIFSKFSKDSLFKDVDGSMSIPIAHVASIVLGNPELANIEELKITLETISNKTIDFFNISDVIDECKQFIISKSPAMERLLQYKFTQESNERILSSIKNQFGKYLKLKVD